MTKNIIALGYLCICLLATNACSKKKETPTTLPNPAGQSEIRPDVVAQTSGQLIAAPNKFHKTLVGKIDNRLDIEMELERDGQNLSGYYFYETIRDYIDLTGKVDKDGAAKITERTPEGKTSGVFTGKLNALEQGGLAALRFEGTWTNARGDKQMPVALAEKTFLLSNGLKLVAKSLKEENKKERYEINAEYPQIEGSGEAATADFNKAVMTLVNDQVRAFKKDAPEAFDKENPNATSSGLFITNNITTANDALISVAFGVSVYFSGAAHPNYTTLTINYDLRNGKPLRLADLFQPGANFVQAVSGYSIKSLKARLKKLGVDDDEMIQQGAGAKADNFQSWNLTPRGLLINFDPYQVAAYAAGQQEVLIPYAALKDIIKPDSPAGQLMTLASLSK